jgi:short-subunit dehydrogenase
MPPTIVITGASRGIGEALALRYARERSCLGLISRNRARLDGVAERCRSAGAQDVALATIDVRSREELINWIDGFDGALRSTF